MFFSYICNFINNCRDVHDIEWELKLEKIWYLFQTMLPCSKPGELYAIDTESVNAGIPYADSFYVTTHFCLSRTSDAETCIAVYAQIKYRKSVWGLVKSKYIYSCYSLWISGSETSPSMGCGTKGLNIYSCYMKELIIILRLLSH